MPARLDAMVAVGLQAMECTYPDATPELSQQLTDFERANLLSSQVDPAILIFAEKIKVQLNLSGGVLATLAFLKPDEVTGLFPAGQIVLVQGFAHFAESLENLVVGNAIAQHKVDRLADLSREAADFVPGVTRDGGEIAGDGGGS